MVKVIIKMMNQCVCVCARARVRLKWGTVGETDLQKTSEVNQEYLMPEMGCFISE